MNATSLTARLTALGFAVILTLVTLSGVDTLAAQQPSTGWMARAAHSTAA